METILQFLHVVSACVLVGSTLFIGFVLIPTLRESLPDQERLSVLRRMGFRARLLNWVSIFLLIGIGLYRIHDLGGFFWDSPYGGILKLKVGLVSFFVILAFLHDFVLGAKATRMTSGTPEFKKLRRLTIILAQLQLVVLLAIIFLSVRLRLYSW